MCCLEDYSQVQISLILTEYGIFWPGFVTQANKNREILPQERLHNSKF